MSRLSYVNGRYVPHEEAVIPLEDRGFQFGDGVYIVMAVYAGRLIDLDAHVDRLAGYGKDIQVSLPFDPEIVKATCREVVRRNRGTEGSLYVQLTRGVAPRQHAFPDEGACPSLVMVYKHQALHWDAENLLCVNVITTPDIRWKRPHIKATSLLPTVLLRQQAKEAGAFDTWLLDENENICEGASSNAYIVTDQGVIVTRPQDGSLVPGVTRARLLMLAKELGISVEERAFSKEEAKNAREAFLSGALSMVKSVVGIDGQAVGTGAPGPVTKRLAQCYFDYCRGTLPITASHVMIPGPKKVKAAVSKTRPLKKNVQEGSWSLAS
jgi:D-alanine transaminase